MRALLDIHVIIALFDPDHAFHERAHVWWSVNRIQGWASCPLTENGAELISRIGEFADQTDHAFWGDSISLRDEGIFERDRMHSTRQITDLYLLALAVSHQGRLVTFDEGIPISAVRNAKITNLCVL